MDKETKEKLLEDIKMAEQKLREQYRPYRDKANKELANILNEIMWSEKMPASERKFTDEKLKKMRELFIAALQELKDFEDKKAQEKEKIKSFYPPKEEIIIFGEEIEEFRQWKKNMQEQNQQLKRDPLEISGEELERKEEEEFNMWKEAIEESEKEQRKKK